MIPATIGSDDSSLRFHRQPSPAANGAQPPDPRELLLAAARGDRTAWNTLYRSHYPHLHRDIAFLTGAPAVTEELAQETFAVAMESIHRFRGQSSFPTWLRGIAHNLVRRHWRTGVRRQRALDRLERTDRACPPGSADLEGRHVDRQRAEILQAILETLSPNLREAFILTDVQGLSASEAAERLSTTAGAISWTLGMSLLRAIPMLQVEHPELTNTRCCLATSTPRGRSPQPTPRA